MWVSSALPSGKTTCATDAGHTVKYVCLRKETGERVVLILSYLIIFCKAETASF